MSLSHKQAHQSAYNKGGDGFKCNVVSIDKVIDPNNSLNMMRTLNACDGNGWCLGENKEGNIIKIDCRPSDAIAVAVRTKSAIYVSENVMMKAKMVNQEKDKEETEKFKEFIDNIKPEDFEKYFRKH